MAIIDNDEDDYSYGNFISLSPVLLLSMPKAHWLLTGPPMPNRFLALRLVLGLGSDILTS